MDEVSCMYNFYILPQDLFTLVNQSVYRSWKNYCCRACNNKSFMHTKIIHSLMWICMYTYMQPVFTDEYIKNWILFRSNESPYWYIKDVPRLSELEEYCLYKADFMNHFENEIINDLWNFLKFFIQAGNALRAQQI